MNTYKSPDKKSDFTFILSLIAIIIVAVYLFMDRIQEYDLSSYFNTAGEKIFAGILDDKNSTQLKEDYNRILEKIKNHEIDPEQVEYLAANLINLKQAEKVLSPDEFKLVLKSTLSKMKSVNIKKADANEEEKWVVLNDKLKQIDNFEKQISSYGLSDKALASSGSIPYVVDDSLNIIVDIAYKKEILADLNSRQNNLNVFNDDKIKWNADIEKRILEKGAEIKVKVSAMQKELETLKEKSGNLNAIVSVPEYNEFVINSPDSSNAFIFHFHTSQIGKEVDSILQSIPKPKTTKAIPQ